MVKVSTMFFSFFFHIKSGMSPTCQTVLVPLRKGRKFVLHLMMDFADLYKKIQE